MDDTIIPMRIVIDTNIFVGACLGTGASGQVIAACIQGRAIPIMSTTLFLEYEDVLSRASLFAHCRLDSAEREELLDIFLARCEWVRVFYLWRPNLRDEGDNHLLELAVSGGAEGLVTRNYKDLSNPVRRFPQVRIFSPEHFLEEIK